MSDFQRNKYVAAAKGTIGRKQFVVEQIRNEESFRKTLSSIEETRVPSRELANKDELLNRGIQYAYQDTDLKGIESAPEDLQKVILFNRGYQVGIRRIKTEGYIHCINGLPLEEAKLKNHLAFIEGYNNAVKKIEAEKNSHKHR